MQFITVNSQEIRDAIDSLQLENEIVCVHSSLRSFGQVEGGANTIVQAFLEAGCTLLVPTHSYGFAVAAPPNKRPQRNGWDYDRYGGSNAGKNKIFTPASKEIEREMGAIPAAVLHHPNSVRGDHPTNSFSGVGPLAEPLLRAQNRQAVHAHLQALADAKGHVLLMGVGLDKMTLLHRAEEVAGRVPFRRWTNDATGQPEMIEAGGCSDGFENFAPTLAPYEQEATVGASLWRLFPAYETLYVAADAIRTNPQITHCGDEECERCRDAMLGGPLLDA